MRHDAAADYHRRMQTSELTYRAAIAADIPAVVALVESAYRGESGLRGWTTESNLLDGQRTDAQDVREAIERPDSLVLLAEHDGALLACCHLEKQDGAAYFGMFAVDPARQTGGVGKQVIAEAERLARTRWGVDRMRMTVIVQREELIAFYERRGYARTGQTKPFPYGDARFGVPRRDDLHFEVLEKPLGEVAA